MPAQMFTAVVAVPGTPQRLTKTTVPAMPVISGVLAGQITPRGTTFVFQADPLNTAAKSIFVGGSLMSVSSRTGIGFALLPGAIETLHLDGETDAGDFFIDTDSVIAANEKVFVTVVG